MQMHLTRRRAARPDGPRGHRRACALARPLREPGDERRPARARAPRAARADVARPRPAQRAGRGRASSDRHRRPRRRSSRRCASRHGSRSSASRSPSTSCCTARTSIVDDVVAMAERLGADRLELANVQLVSWALANAAALLPSRAQIERARAVARRREARLEGRMEVVFVLPDWHAGRPRACMDGWGRRFVVVAPDGAVLPCHAARVAAARLRACATRSLAQLWREATGMRRLPRRALDARALPELRPARASTTAAAAARRSR